MRDADGLMGVQKNVYDRYVGGGINKTWRVFKYER